MAADNPSLAATDEHHCHYVSSRGILKSVNTHIAIPKSSNRKIPLEFARRLNSKANVIYLNPEMLQSFVRFHLWRIRAPFSLVTGDSDMEISEKTLPRRTLNALLDNHFLSAWHAQNLNHKHEKLHLMPIGVDYHTLAPSTALGDIHEWGTRISPLKQEEELIKTRLEAGPLLGKDMKAFSNWHFAPERGNRRDCLEKFPKELASFQADFLPREASWRQNAQYAFTLSPTGNGFDCHRTWEALLLGTIPVVKSTPLDPLYEELPVVILDSWRAFTKDRMKREMDRALTGKFQFEKLTLDYWSRKISGETPFKTEPMGFEEFRLTEG